MDRSECFLIQVKKRIEKKQRMFVHQGSVLWQGRVNLSSKRNVRMNSGEKFHF